MPARGDTRRLVVEADGGSRGNPGVAGYGALVRDAETGSVLAERAAPLGKRSNNVAEYRGLIAGLESVVAIDPSATVEVRMDSKLVIEQMAGRWKIKHEDMQALALEARDLVRRIRAAGGSISWTWIPRERNKAADKLSNDGMDGVTVDRILTSDRETAAAAAPTPGYAPQQRVADPPSPRLTASVLVLLVRHGSTELTTQGRLSGGGGLSNPSLDATGVREAAGVAALAAALVAERGTAKAEVRLVTSTLARARETGAVIAEALDVRAEVDDGWDEQGFGYWDGLTVAQVTSRWPQAWSHFVDASADAADQRHAGGESTAELAARVQEALSRAAQAPGLVVVVTSRRPILATLATALGMSAAALEPLQIDPGSVTAVEVLPDGSVTVPFVNRTGQDV